jgi:glycerol uptake facilitator-like aquaporin
MIGRRLLAEGLGAAFLLATIVGSGITAERLAGGNEALALLGNTLPTGAMLAVLITIFAPVSGAHLNPVMTVALALRGEFAWSEVAPYIGCQVIGALVGVAAAHAMFGTALFDPSTIIRSGTGQWLGEGMATFGLVLTVLACVSQRSVATPWLVGLYITAAYWVTSSTSFANPAGTIGRALSDTFAGIAPASVPGFLAAQVVGMLLAVLIARQLWGSTRAFEYRLAPNGERHAE